MSPRLFDSRIEELFEFISILLVLRNQSDPAAYGTPALQSVLGRFSAIA
jgi:hypothetical protein